MGNKSSSLQPEVINDIKSHTGFSHAEICDLYRQFRIDSKGKGGTMTESDFKNMYREVFPTGDPDKFAHNIFKTYDKGGLGSINFRQFITHLSVQLKGSYQQKLEWAFDVYDIENTGYITKEELADMIRSMSELHSGALPAEDRIPANQLTDYIFEKADLDKTGKISRAEFLQVAITSRTLQRMVEGTTDAASSPYTKRKERSGSLGKPRSSSFRLE